MNSLCKQPMVRQNCQAAKTVLGKLNAKVNRMIPNFKSTFIRKCYVLKYLKWMMF
jgi:hypothetical protein